MALTVEGWSRECTVVGVAFLEAEAVTAASTATAGSAARAVGGYATSLGRKLLCH